MLAACMHMLQAHCWVNGTHSSAAPGAPLRCPNSLAWSNSELNGVIVYFEVYVAALPVNTPMKLLRFSAGGTTRSAPSSEASTTAARWAYA